MVKRIVDLFCMESDSESVVGFSIRGYTKRFMIQAENGRYGFHKYGEAAQKMYTAASAIIATSGSDCEEMAWLTCVAMNGI